MLPENINEMYSQFYDTVRKNETFDSKTTLLLFLASSMAVACYP